MRYPVATEAIFRIGDPLRRRDFITLLGSAAADWPHVTRALQAAAVLVVAGLVMIAPLRADDLSDVRVLAAGSLRVAFDEIGVAFQNRTGVKIADFGDRYWTLPIYDARTDEISQLGLQYSTGPGFYVIVGPNWKGDVSSGIAEVVGPSTDFAAIIPRVFMNDTSEHV